MNTKVKKIDKEINELISKIRKMEDINQNCLTPEVKELQSSVLSSHLNSEIFVKGVIISKLFSGSCVNKEVAKKVISALGYRKKVSILKDNKLLSSDKIKKLENLNKLRNEFVHMSGLDINIRYGYKDIYSKNKENYRNALRKINEASDIINDYCNNELKK